jgi:hypothetical protein
VARLDSVGIQLVIPQGLAFYQAATDYADERAADCGVVHRTVFATVNPETSFQESEQDDFRGEAE